jgi:hypothetical protein
MAVETLWNVWGKHRGKIRIKSRPFPLIYRLRNVTMGTIPGGVIGHPAVREVTEGLYLLGLVGERGG